MCIDEEIKKLSPSGEDDKMSRSVHADLTPDFPSIKLGINGIAVYIESKEEISFFQKWF